MRYIQLTEDLIVVGDLTSSEPIYDTQLVYVDYEGEIELGRTKYIDGEFVPYEPPTPPTEPTQLDRIETQLDDADTIQAELLFNQANSDLDTQLILETLAEILLNQQGV